MMFIGRRDNAMAKRRLGAAVCGLLLALGLGACSPGMVADRLPTDWGGLPADTPARPSTPVPYPAVHDVPARATGPMSLEEQLRAERELARARAKQQVLKDPGAAARAKSATEKSNAARERAVEAAKTKRPEPESR